MRIKLSTLDSLFSRYVRLLSGGYCKRCGHYVGYRKLHNAHFHSRRKHSIRWDMDNTAPLCYGCHSHIDGNPFIKIEFFLALLGQERFNQLNERAQRLYPKVDKEALKFYYTEKIKQLEVNDAKFKKSIGLFGIRLGKFKLISDYDWLLIQKEKISYGRSKGAMQASAHSWSGEDISYSETKTSLYIVKKATKDHTLIYRGKLHEANGIIGLLLKKSPNIIVFNGSIKKGQEIDKNNFQINS